MIDGVITSFPQPIILAVLKAVGAGAVVQVMFSFFAGFIFSAAYCTWMIAAKGGQTLGKMAAGIAVTRMDGSPVSYGRAFGRWCGYFVSTLPCLGGYVMAAFMDKKQSLHDYLAETRVVFVQEVPTARKAAVIAGPFLALFLFLGMNAYNLVSSGTFAALKLDMEKGLEAQSEELKEHAEALIVEAKTFAKGKPQTACMDEAVSRLEACGFLCQIENTIFFRACLDSAEPDEALCAGVPDSILGSVAWRLEECEKVGREGDQPCTRLMGQVQDYCGKKAEGETPAKDS